MTVTLNGEQRQFREGLTIVDLVVELGLKTRRIAVEVNREIIARDDYATYHLQADDVIEIVQFVGGG
jgi:sulfur carrier protein